MAQHQAILENIASTDNVESAFFFPSTALQTNNDGRDDWSLIRDAVKQKIEEVLTPFGQTIPGDIQFAYRTSSYI